MFDRKASSGKVLDSYLDKKKQDSSIGCFVATCVLLGKNSAKLVVGSSSPISAETAKGVIFATTKHRLIPFVPSLEVFEDKKNRMFYASMVAHRTKTQYLPLEGNEDKMAKITSTAFLSQDFGNIWEKKEIEGKLYFVRSNDEDLDKILEDVQMSASANVRGTTSIDNFTPDLKPGEGVEFFTLVDETPGKAVGVIKEVTNATVKISTGDIEVEIPKHAVIKSLFKIEGASSIKEVLDYLTKAYGNKEYVKLFKK